MREDCRRLLKENPFVGDLPGVNFVAVALGELPRVTDERFALLLGIFQAEPERGVTAQEMVFQAYAVVAAPVDVFVELVIVKLSFDWLDVHPFAAERDHGVIENLQELCELRRLNGGRLVITHRGTDGGLLEERQRCAEIKCRANFLNINRRAAERMTIAVEQLQADIALAVFFDVRQHRLAHESLIGLPAGLVGCIHRRVGRLMIGR